MHTGETQNTLALTSMLVVNNCLHQLNKDLRLPTSLGGSLRGAASPHDCPFPSKVGSGGIPPENKQLQGVAHLLDLP